MIDPVERLLDVEEECCTAQLALSLYRVRGLCVRLCFLLLLLRLCWATSFALLSLRWCRVVERGELCGTECLQRCEELEDGVGGGVTGAEAELCS